MDKGYDQERCKILLIQSKFPGRFGMEYVEIVLRMYL